jgi:spoIIIJ-associated protein
MEDTMKSEVMVTAPTVEEAVAKALLEMEAEREQVKVEVIKEPAKRFFGESTDAEVKVTLISEEDDEAEVEAEESLSEDDSPEEDSPEEESAEEGSTEEEPEPEPEPSEEDDDEAEEEEASEIPEKNFNQAPLQLTDEEIDLIADTAIETIQGFLGYFGIENATIDEYEGDEGELILDIGGDNLAVLIGRHGKTLDSFQFLVAAIVGKKTGYRYPVSVDIEGYKHRRRQKLIGIAKASATRAIRQKHDVNLRPMSPYERRIIHVTLKGDKRITTHSEGVEPNRYVVIHLV